MMGVTRIQLLAKMVPCVTTFSKGPTALWCTYGIWTMIFINSLVKHAHRR